MHTLNYGILNLTLNDNIVRYLANSFTFLNLSIAAPASLLAKHAPVIACGRKLPKDVDRVWEI